MDDWLKKRLTPVKKDTPRWQQFAESIQDLWQTCFDPDLDRVKRANSIYTADTVDLQREIGELGDFFQALPKEEDMAIAVAWRKLELLFKDREFIITSTFARKFSGLPVSWVPLWAKKSDDYGDEFYREDEISDFDDYYMTSRGLLAVDLAEMTARRITITAFVDHVVSRIDTIKPLHIIYDRTVFERTKSVPLYLGIAKFFSTTYTINPPLLTFDLEISPTFGGGIWIGSTITITISQGA